MNAKTNDRQVTENDIREMARRIIAAADPIKVILFGSRARGNARPTSDVDLLVIERDPVTHHKEATRLRRLLRDFKVPIDIVVIGQSFAERYWDIPGTVLYPAFREGKVLYGQ
ncbi:MAG TPA: nucleotidyltransferase domain-containing protein [Anaerolineales bacterium]|nr:nucleotidyltransferase domain-containing protein [Anaerolineales bacterium]